MEGLTASEMAKILGISTHSVTVRLLRAGIKPKSYEAVYDPSALDTIREARRGRPKKQPEPGLPKEP